ncbi:MAG: hypothetical protein WCF18_18545, partial [Chthoniobacteraceae bacterium]
SRPESVGIFGWLRARWIVAIASTAAVALIATVAIEQPERPDPLLAIASQVSTSPDYQVIDHLDELLDSEQNSVWLEASAF